MNPVLQFLSVSLFIWAFKFCHARDCTELSPSPNPSYLHQFKPSYPPPVSLPPTPLVQDKQAHLDKELLLAIIISSAVITFLLLSTICACFIWRRNSLNTSLRNVQISDTIEGPVLNRFNPLSIRGSIPEIEYTLIQSATNNFSQNNILAKEGHGSLYKAHFNFFSLAAVKKYDCKEPCCERAFENEIVLLSNVKHPNIISLFGYCVHLELRLLVYELMQNGSLESQLHGWRLSWDIRVKIALETARGLEYLHEHCNPPVVHRALKSSNILLDSNFNVKISDFAVAIAGGNENENSLKLSHTGGHVAPEYFLNGELTQKSDVYSFGVVLLELLMGRKLNERMIGSRSQCQSGVKWVMPQLTDREKLPDIVDPVIRHSMDIKHLCQVAAVAVLCVQQEPSYRPLISDVVYSLIPLVPVELGGTLKVSEPDSC
ncbi:uncharacterized protein A4U43_C08F8010 [Asparagus officinalis]|uniref:probable receptor-like protein kinase At1g80640 n=1 Tax=Asparagus officinalis TaxID=4686 RepID=UPI00098E4017|nr:probable receptor-like protein kinase At1g80640 [Asparagus officinalis]ONK59588.1 uncharacterized protein A4U43_C08F8010 [Asparagus officinalis]